MNWTGFREREKNGEFMQHLYYEKLAKHGEQLGDTQRKTWRVSNEMLDVLKKKWCRATQWSIFQLFILVWGLLHLMQLRRRLCYCIYLYVSSAHIQNIDLQHADSAALNLPSQLKPACGSALTLVPAKWHSASYCDHQPTGLPPTTEKQLSESVENKLKHQPVVAQYRSTESFFRK